MSLPTLGCRVAFASDPFATTLVWTEIGIANSGTGDVIGARTKRGRERLLRSTAQFQAGSSTIKLRNRQRSYDPTNTAGPYYPNVQPEKVVQLYAVWAGVEHIIWTGYADDWAQSWPGFAESIVTVVATDLFKNLAVKRMWGTSYLSLALQNAPTTLISPESPPYVPVDGIPYDGGGGYGGSTGGGGAALEVATFQWLGAPSGTLSDPYPVVHTSTLQKLTLSLAATTASSVTATIVVNGTSAGSVTVAAGSLSNDAALSVAVSAAISGGGSELQCSLAYTSALTGAVVTAAMG